MPHDKTLYTVREVVAALGGTSAAAEVVGVNPPAVSNALAKGCFPPKWFLPIDDALALIGHTADRALFRETPRVESEANAD